MANGIAVNENARVVVAVLVKWLDTVLSRVIAENMGWRYFAFWSQITSDLGHLCLYIVDVIEA